ncbi:superfamily II DNA/RNA helicase [Kitasatospora sp. MAP12-15]|uniref:hypothetical protein n=1 Tax=unclassified Kitasatospora TaxID=2633591 RepID=UPI002476E92A|nr:hypothetical protein [Kitasatospora sp. MAP12-44]MDH6113533.1 superfamily II DNA/RNA helicase [Kitasatospora sp. MAP12-44]
MRDTLREYVEFATGLAEGAGKRVVGTATGLLERAGVDLEAVERTVAAQLPPSVQSLQTLVGELATAGRTGVDLAVGLARTEAEKAVERVGRLGDQVVKVGVVLSYLEGKLRDLEGGEPEQRPSADRREPPAARAQGLFGEDWWPEEESAALDEEPVLDEEPAPAAVPAKKAAPRKAAPRKAAPAKAAVKKTAVRKTAAKQPTAAKKATEPKKTATKKTAAAKPAAAKTATKKAPAKKATRKDGDV